MYTVTDILTSNLHRNLTESEKLKIDDRVNIFTEKIENDIQKWIL